MRNQNGFVDDALTDETIDMYEETADVLGEIPRWQADDLIASLRRSRKDAMDMHDRLLRSEQLNAELARMLRKLEWSGIGPDGQKQCPVCFFLPPPVTTRLAHDPNCALAALLKKATTE